ncbi:MAG: metal ABC transporter substrate-binding protein [Eubacteriales bacterium]|nr:metal ABC transporter substrate-binding protein [Eubacteriales bacterium]
MKRLLPTLLCVLLLTGCAARAEHTADDGKMSVVCTLFPYYDFARQIAGDRAEVTLLLSPGREAHSFEPTPRDALTIASADVFVYNGGEGELWVEEMLDSSGENIGTALCMMDCVDAHEEEIVEGMQVHEHEHEHEDSDEIEYDEHIWTSPQNAIVLCRAVCEAMCAQDEKNAEAYRANCERCCTELAALDGEFRALREEAKRDLLIFADRFPFLYFCEEYDLHYRAAFHGCSTDTEPSLATLKFLIDKVEQENIPVVYTVDLSSRKIAEVVAESTGAEVGVLYSMQTVSRADFEAGETYVSLMERNLETLREGLL